jgi:hypothetical protein
MAGKVVVDTIETGAGDSASAEEVVKGCAKAWVNFQTLVTTSILRSFNVSSVTDIGVGISLVNFSTPMDTANYAVSTFAQNTVGGGQVTAQQVSTYKTKTTTQCHIVVIDQTLAGSDPGEVSAVFFE